MKCISLVNLDSSFEILFNGDSLFNIESINDTESINSGSIVFIKNNKFLVKLMKQDLTNKKIGIILEKKFLGLISAIDLENMKIFAEFIGTVDDVNVSMSKMSKTFFDLKYSNVNDLVDGRQMGTASIHPASYIAQNVFIGENVKIHSDVKLHPGCVIMAGAEIGEGTELYPNVTICRDVKIGKNVRIHSGSTIGSDGFGYNFFKGEHLKVWHMGSVIIHDNVEIGACSSVDGGTFSPTIIGEGSKIDNQVQIAHNCHVGSKVIICGNVALAGSCTLHDYVVVGGMASIGNGVVVGAGAQVAAYSGVISDVEPKETVGGFPARKHKEWMRGVALVRKLSLKKNEES